MLCGTVIIVIMLATLCGAQEGVLTTPSGAEHEFVVVPEGSFTMGADPHALPVREVYLDRYWIGKYEVTNEHFAAYLNSVGDDVDSLGHELIVLGSRYAQIVGCGTRFEPQDGDHAGHPATSVTWYGAAGYCRWIGCRLPTEAEWEKAARGTDGRTYPWGEDLDRTRANYGAVEEPINRPDEADGYLESAPVGAFPAGVSPYGVHDMAGNVSEWVADWYGYYYDPGQTTNPEGPSTGTKRVRRGGDWLGTPYTLQTTWRAGDQPSIPHPQTSPVGLRCARSAPLPTQVEGTSWGAVKERVVGRKETGSR